MSTEGIGSSSLIYPKIVVDAEVDPKFTEVEMGKIKEAFRDVANFCRLPEQFTKEMVVSVFDTTHIKDAQYGEMISCGEDAETRSPILYIPASMLRKYILRDFGSRPIDSRVLEMITSGHYEEWQKLVDEKGIQVVMEEALFAHYISITEEEFKAELGHQIASLIFVSHNSQTTRDFYAANDITEWLKDSKEPEVQNLPPSDEAFMRYEREQWVFVAKVMSCWEQSHVNALVSYGSKFRTFIEKLSTKS